MARLRSLAMFVVAGIASSAAAAVLVTSLGLAYVGGLLGLIFGPLFGILFAVEGVKWAGAPAAIIGGMLWSLGRRHDWARRRLTWSATGALVGLAYWLVVGLSAPQGAPYPLSITALFAISGIGAALFFRWIMDVLLLFFPDPDDFRPA